MITSLTLAQQDKVSEYRERGIELGLCTDRIAREKAQVYGKKLMSFLGRDCKAVVVVPGLIHAWVAVLELVCGRTVRDIPGSQVWSQVGSQIEDQVWSQAWSQIEDQVWSQAWSQVWDQVGSQVRAQVVKQVWSQVWSQVVDRVWSQVWSQVGDQVGFVWPYMCGQFWAEWVAWADYCREVLSLELCDYSIIAEQVEFGPIYPLERFCVICDRPSEIHMVDGQLHYDGGPAVEYDDGTRVWALHGVRVEQWLAETPYNEIDVRKFASIENAEIRREFVRKVGVERISETLDAKVLDRSSDGGYELLEIDLRGATGCWPYLKMMNPSLGVWHMEAVAREVRTVEAALNWRNQSDLRPEQLT